MKKKIELRNITLLATTSVDVDETQISMRISAHNINFGSLKLLSSKPPSKKYPDIEYISIPHMDFNGYSKFIIEDLYKYFNTSHCLIVQADSFVVNSDLWKDVFLDFDYIGAPWSDKIEVDVGSKKLVLELKETPVGNGGFSLRSRKLVKECSKINYNSLNYPIKSEDIIICHYLYKEMLDNGIRFAPPNLAAQFSMENVNHLYGQNVNNVFGFHGKHLRDYFIKKYIINSAVGEW